MAVEIHRATGVVYEGGGDSLRVRSNAPKQPKSAMRDVALAMDADGHLVAIVFEDSPPRPAIMLGPHSAVAGWKEARVLAMESGEVLITMGMKRVRGHERNPYVPWAIYPDQPT